MRPLRTPRIAALAALGATIAATSVAAGAEVTLKFGYVTGAPHPYGQTMTQFKANVERESGGRIAISLIPRYAGGDDNVLYDDIKAGTVQGGAVSTAVWPNKAGTKAFIPLQLPFVVDNYPLEERLINGSTAVAKRMISSASNKSGLKVLGILEGGMRQLVTKTGPINSLADLRGKKLRSVQSNPLIANMRALGISPTPLPVGDVFVGLQNGTVDGAEANSALVQTFRWNSAGANRIALINWFPFPAAVAMNKAAFDALPADLQKVITDQATLIPTFSISVVNGDANKVGVPTALCAAGVKYHKVSPGARAAMVNASKGVIKSLTRDPEVKAIYNTILRLKPRFPTQDSDLPPATCLE